MQIRITDLDNRKKKWLYEVDWLEVRNTIQPYEAIYLMDDDYLDVLAIDICVKSFFGKNAEFSRYHQITDYRCGKIRRNGKDIVDNVLIEFIEDEDDPDD